MNKVACRIVALVLLITVAGCNRSPFDFAKVSGQVLLDGKPVPNAKVTFMPRASGENGEAGPYSKGETNDEGRFELMSIEDSPTKGAVVGQHRIIISTKKAHRHPTKLDTEVIDVEEIIPHPYNNYRKTPLTFDVTSDGSDSADFELVSK